MKPMDSAEYFSGERINLTGSVNADMVVDLDRQIKAIDIAKPIVVTIMSPGGLTGYSRGIYEELRQLDSVAKDLAVVSRGICMSAAVTLTMAIPRERRYAMPDTKFMIHQASLGPGTTSGGSTEERAIANKIKDVNDKADTAEADWVVQALVQGTDQTEAKIRKKMRYGHYLIGQHAIDFGLVGHILSPLHRPTKKS